MNLQTPVTITDNIPLQVGSLIMAVMAIITIGIIVKRDRTLLMWFVLPVLWLMHGIIFYVVLFLTRYTDVVITPLMGSYTVWSSILRFQTHFTAFSLVLTYLVLQIIKQRKYGPK